MGFFTKSRSHDLGGSKENASLGFFGNVDGTSLLNEKGTPSYSNGDESTKVDLSKEHKSNKGISSLPRRAANAAWKKIRPTASSTKATTLRV